MAVDAAHPNNDDDDFDNLVIEEVWDLPTTTGYGQASTMGGRFSLQSQHQIHIVDFGRGNVLRYMSIPDHEMTPLDMMYGKNLNLATETGTTKGRPNDDEDDEEDYDEHYDGTGNLMWTAALCFGHLLAQNVQSLRKYLERSPSASSSSSSVSAPATSLPSHRQYQQQQQHRICELGCGTGGAGIALLLFLSSWRPQASSVVDNDTVANSGASPYHVVFTDSDPESLDLCRRNCELNRIDPNLYTQCVLVWGQHQWTIRDDIGGSHAKTDDTAPLGEHTFDTVLATDVVYDIKMIPPMLQTAHHLLKTDDGYLILSHVPRFCLPKGVDDNNLVVPTDDGAGKDMTDKTVNHTRAYLALEQHIKDEAAKFGLHLVEAIRPHLVLEELPMSTYGDGSNQSYPCDDQPQTSQRTQHLTLDDIKEAHAVILVFGRRNSNDAVFGRSCNVILGHPNRCGTHSDMGRT